MQNQVSKAKNGVGEKTLKSRVGLWGALAGSIPTILPALNLFLQSCVLTSTSAQVDACIGITSGFHRFLDHIVHVTNGPSLLILFVGPIMHLIGLVCWLGLWFDPSLKRTVKGATGISLLLAISLTSWWWYNFWKIT
jgi:hypothetical protein